MDFIVTQCGNLIFIISDSSLQLTQSSCHWSSSGIVLKNVHNYLKHLPKYSLFICVRLDFLPTLQQEEYVAQIECRSKDESPAVFKADIRDLQNVKQCCSCQFCVVLKILIIFNELSTYLKFFQFYFLLPQVFIHIAYIINTRALGSIIIFRSIKEPKTKRL